MRNAAILSALVAMALSNATLLGDDITINLSAEISYVDDPHGVLMEQVNVGDIMSGSYTYDSEVSDTNPLPTVGDYWHDAPPYGIALNVGGFQFQTDPDDVDFLVEIVNDHGSLGGDNYLLRSYKNMPLYEGVHVEHISWQLDDFSGEAISSIALPVTPPVLEDWESIFGISINGGSMGDPIGGDYFFIRAHVTSVTLENVPPLEQVFAILDFIEASVADGTLSGNGPGKSAERRLNALTNMITAAGQLIADDSIGEACEQLSAAYGKCDGESRPPDFVSGPAAAELAAMIQDLMADLGCP